MPSVEPDIRWVPSESHFSGDFSAIRDLTPCFPKIEKRMIHLETAEGEQIASDAMNTLKLVGMELEDVTFKLLWAFYERAKARLEERDAIEEEFMSIYMAYDRIAAHICATRHEEYEEARVSRYIRYTHTIGGVVDPAVAGINDTFLARSIETFRHEQPPCRGCGVIWTFTDLIVHDNDTLYKRCIICGYDL